MQLRMRLRDLVDPLPCIVIFKDSHVFVLENGLKIGMLHYAMFRFSNQGYRSALRNIVSVNQ